MPRNYHSQDSATFPGIVVSHEGIKYKLYGTVSYRCTVDSNNNKPPIIEKFPRRKAFELMRYGDHLYVAQMFPQTKKGGNKTTGSAVWILCTYWQFVHHGNPDPPRVREVLRFEEGNLARGNTIRLRTFWNGHLLTVSLNSSLKKTRGKVAPNLTGTEGKRPANPLEGAVITSGFDIPEPAPRRFHGDYGIVLYKKL